MAGRTGKDEKVLRQHIVDACLWMNAVGINQGTSGNVSARHGERMLITPTGVPYDVMTPDDIASMPLDGDYGSYEGDMKPSSEWRFHLDIMKSRPDIGAVIHTHSIYCTVLACARKSIPAVHYMIAAAGGPTVRCAEYATFGTKELSQNALCALHDRNCCLLANHGMIATGADLGKAQWLALELETLARQYYLTLSIGGPVLLSDEEIARNMELFKGYGVQESDQKQSGVATKIQSVSAKSGRPARRLSKKKLDA
jgi:L-fuculose-phosphate aldolase